MAEMVCSALVQETVSRAVSIALGMREEKASQGHLLERLEMAVSQLEFALERAQELRIRHLSLIRRRNQIKSVYVEATELLDMHKQQKAVPARAGQELQDAHGVKKRKRWVIGAKNMLFTSSFAGLSTDAVRRFELYADYADKFLRDVESGCSLHHYTFCNPIVRHLLEGKTLLYFLDKERCFFIWPTYSDERGVEAMLIYIYDDSTMAKKNFNLVAFLRLSESTDIVGLAIKGLQLLTSEFKVAAECATGELTRPSTLQDLALAHWYRPPMWADTHSEATQLCRKGSRHGVCDKNNVSSELSDIFPEQVIYWWFECYYVPALEPRRSPRSSFDVVGGSKSRGGGSGKPPLLLTAVFAPHAATGAEYSHATIGGVEGYRDAGIQQVVEAIRSDVVNSFFRQPEQTEYNIFWYSRHGFAGFWVENATTKRGGAHKTSSRYNTRGSARRSSRR